ncbi:2-keto-4-pentenoate hydratase [Glaciibacter psychrotolerans]|uniref:2-keto-4-pentenoate hydratase n=1 Tax=Glaciibacter psychrotolerans TaxID=670054 RepID=A0A7Z0J7Y2_9MICO|nr:2-keto-4-pentenoate hydratase [Leifsonia psychrotolerans]NYJ21349.1 2-keto-4-pentenoate hydratase [Leifsonia psychrotolerans]
MVNSATRTEAARALRQAAANREPIARLSSTFPGLSLADAYAIQTLNIQLDVASGSRIIGHKLGLTSPVMQEMMGVDEPDFGHLMDTMLLDSTRAVSLGSYIQPRIEVELAFVLAEALSADCTEADVLSATAYVVPCIELIDSRIENWNIHLIDTIADNASSAAVILGDTRISPLEWSLDDIDARLVINGQEVAAGSTSAVLGHPARSVAWLARTLAGFGVALEPGHVVLSGSCTRAIDVVPGDRAEARFTGLGDVVVTFD